MTDARTVFEQELSAVLAARPELADRVDAVLQVEIAGEGGGVWAIDLTRANAPPTVRPGEDPAARCRIRIGGEDFAELLDGRQRWTDAFVRGKIAIAGDLVLALKLRKLFADFAPTG